MSGRRNSSKKPQTRKSSTSSTRSSLVIKIVAVALLFTAVTVGAALYLLRPANIDWPNQEYLDAWKESSSKGPFIRNEAWLNENLYKVSSYKKLDGGLYSVYLLMVEDPPECSFEELCEIFNNATFAMDNSYCLADGVNCQGMTYYIVKWCQKTNTEYAVDYYSTHVNVSVFVGGSWYLMDFNSERKIVPFSADLEGNK